MIISRPSFVRAVSWATAAFFATGPLVTAAEKAAEQVSPFYGSFSYAIPIEVPAFHGLEPKLALAYSSEGRNGLVGVGWALSGFSTMERVNPGRGTPRFDANDIYLLDGQDVVPCSAVANSSGVPMTFFRPTNGAAYWLAQQPHP